MLPSFRFGFDVFWMPDFELPFGFFLMKNKKFPHHLLGFYLDYLDWAKGIFTFSSYYSNSCAHK